MSLGCFMPSCGARLEESPVFEASLGPGTLQLTLQSGENLYTESLRLPLEENTFQKRPLKGNRLKYPLFPPTVIHLEARQPVEPNLFRAIRFRDTHGYLITSECIAASLTLTENGWVRHARIQFTGAVPESVQIPVPSDPLGGRWITLAGRSGRVDIDTLAFVPD